MLRLDLRKSKGTRADRPLGQSRFALDEPTEVIETPFMTARYYYDVALPAVPGIERGQAYTWLLRVLNPDGLAVTEEQQVRFEWPMAGFGESPAHCREAAGPSTTKVP